MTRVNTYLNFMGNTEEAFNFYKKVFRSEFTSLTRMGDMPRPAGAPPLADSDSSNAMGCALGFVSG